MVVQQEHKEHSFSVSQNKKRLGKMIAENYIEKGHGIFE